MIKIFFKYKEHRIHKNNGPAIFYSSGSIMYIYAKNGEYHREDGPAVIWSDGDKWYYLNDKKYSKEEYYEKLKELNINIK